MYETSSRHPQGPGPGNRGQGGGQGGGQGSWGTPGGEMIFSIPTIKCGLVIGQAGENLKSLNQQTGAFVDMLRQPPPNGDPNLKLFIIRGTPQQINHAKVLIERKIEVSTVLVFSCIRLKQNHVSSSFSINILVWNLFSFL